MLHLQPDQMHGAEQVGGLKQLILGRGHLPKLHIGKKRVEYRGQNLADFDLAVVVIDFDAVAAEEFVVMGPDKGGDLPGQPAGSIYGVAGLDPIYMTYQDYALEVGLTTSWKMYENFTIMLDASYLALWLRNDVWRDSPMRTSAGTQGGVRDAWNIDLTFAYVF